MARGDDSSTMDDTARPRDVEARSRDSRARPAFEGISIPPFWRILPPSRAGEGDGVCIVLDPGVGFGTGTHETTQLCLQAIAHLAPKRDGYRMLDFGSGSGILAIGAAKLGARVDGVEIDDRALAESIGTARRNGVAERVRFSRTLAEADGPFDFVAANILRGVLLDFAAELVARLDPHGTLVLSGLVSTDVPEVVARYAALFDGRRPEIFQRGEWRALAWLCAP